MWVRARVLLAGLDETLTVLRLGVPPNPRAHAALDEHYRVDDLRVPRTRRQRQTVAGWQHGAALVCGSMVEAGKQFRRVNGHLHLPALGAAKEREFAEPVGPVVHNDEVSAV
jgi:hypothetical protein